MQESIANDDPLIPDLVEDLRRRARFLRVAGYGFIGAVILTVLAAGVLYYYIPALAQFEAAQRTDALAKLQEQISAQDGKLSELDVERDGLVKNFANAIYLPGVRANPKFLIESLRAVQFLDAQTGWAVGSSGQMVKITTPDVSGIESIASDAALREALMQLGSDGPINTDPLLARLGELEKKRAFETSIKNALRSQIERSEGGVGSIFGQKFDVTLNITRIGLVVLILFLVGVFTALYRYNLRLAAFYDSRADALMMLGSQDHDHTLGELADIFGPDSIEFVKARAPADQFMDLAKEAIKTRSKT